MKPPFLDTNIVLYLLSSDDDRADRAEALVAEGGVISVQVLNEAVSVCTRKMKMPWPAVEALLAALRSSCRVEPLTMETHAAALAIARRYQLSFYDALILATAALAGCGTVYSEDMQHGLRIDHEGNRLRIANPFRAA
jgi:predicted nucleic acid-binding protein